jgi:hypothetical protein
MTQHSRNLGQQPDDYSDAGPVTTAGELKIVGAWLSRKDMLFGYAAQWFLAVTRLALIHTRLK